MVYGGLGTGLYSILLVALLGLFITGLMVGRTPEYVGKKIGEHEIKLIAVYILIGPAIVLVLTAVAVLTPLGLAGLTTNSGPHGLTEIFYAYTSSFANNGQTFSGLSADTPFYNVTTAIAMLLGRFGLAIPALVLAQRLASQPTRASSQGTFATDSLLFAQHPPGRIVFPCPYALEPLGTAEMGSEALRFFSANCSIAAMIPPNSCPRSVRWYSTRGGISRKARRSTNPISSRALSRWVRVFELICPMSSSSSLKRFGPRRRPMMMSRTQVSPIKRMARPIGLVPQASGISVICSSSAVFIH
jgi:Potassium-transporting ATPase A subunit